MATKLEAFEVLGMIVIGRKAVSIGSVSVIEEQLSGNLLLTLVSGKEIALDQTEAEQFLKIASDLAYNLRVAAMQQGAAPVRRVTH